MRSLIAIAKYAFFWQVTQVRNVHRAGVNSVPVPYADKFVGLVLGTCAAIALFTFIGWVLGVVKYALSDGPEGG